MQPPRARYTVNPAKRRSLAPSGRKASPKFHTPPFSVKESGLNAISPSLANDIYDQHNCDICKHGQNQNEKSLIHHKQLQPANTGHNKHISPPQPLPQANDWKYLHPPVFCPQIVPINIALTLQELLEHGLTFQTPKEGTSTPFLTPFEGILNLNNNLPPLTHFQLAHQQQRISDHYNTLLTKLKKELKTHKLKILQADKGPGLIILQENTLTKLYQLYFENSTTITDTETYLKSLHDLKVIYYMILYDTKMNNTDDRPPTIYFKVKTHKTTFVHTTTQHENIYTYSNGATDLLPITRAIINHKNTITSSCSNIFRELLKPVIQANSYLTEDVFQTINNLCAFGHPEEIYTADIEAFYPNTSHDLILDAFKHYHPDRRLERQLLRRLLKFNYTTNSINIFYLGEKGIPMGLPIAPELARMCTAFLTRDYTPPPGHVLTIYFDDLATTYPIDLELLKPYTIKTTEPNQTQDCKYDTRTKKFHPIQQQHRQPVLLNPNSYHPSTKMSKNTYKSSAFRATKIGTDPSDILQHLLLKYLPALTRSGHNPRETITTLVNTSYFPSKSTKLEWEPKPTIKYTFSDTRPTKHQLETLELKDYRLIPSLPMPPLKAILCYNPPSRQSSHTYHLCTNTTCDPCNKYTIILTNNLTIPVIPCTYLRCTYLLHTPETNDDNDKTQMYIDQCNIANVNIDEMVLTTAITKLLQGRNILWQILAVHNATYQKPYKVIDPSIEKWKGKLQAVFPTAIIYTYPHMQQFYRNTTKTN